LNNLANVTEKKARQKKSTGLGIADRSGINSSSDPLAPKGAFSFLLAR